VTRAYVLTAVTITDNLFAGTAGGDDPSGTVRVHATNVALYNLNIANTYGKVGDQSQAIALSVYGSQFGAYGLKASCRPLFYTKCTDSCSAHRISGHVACGVWLVRSSRRDVKSPVN
jgi:hypothetical protein